MLTLIFEVDGAPQQRLLSDGDTLVGRAPTCDLVIDHPSVSRRHARLHVENGHCTLTDLGSSNGTQLNGVVVTTCLVSDGDRLVFGQIGAELQERLDDVALSDERMLVDVPNTVYRPIEQMMGSAAAAAPARVAPVTGVAPRVLGMLTTIGRSLLSTDASADVLNRIGDLLFESLPAERGFLMIRDEASGELVARLARNREGVSLTSASISRTMAKLVMSERIAVLTADAPADARLSGSDSIAAGDVHSVMCAPLWDEAHVIGILYADSPITRSFSSDDLDVFTALSHYAALAIQRARLARRFEDERRVRERLERYHSSSVVQRILKGSGDEADTRFIAQERDLTVLFADIVGFTTIAEQMRPTDVAKLLNVYFSAMADVIFEHEGTLDKFVGDAVMAVFGAPLDQPDHATRGVRAAIAMRAAVDQLNANRLERAVQVRFALNSGLAVAGEIGSLRRREFTVLGDVVNMAARFESDVAEPGQIVIGRGTYDRVGSDVPMRSLGFSTLRGRTTPVEAFLVEP